MNIKKIKLIEKEKSLSILTSEKKRYKLVLYGSAKGCIDRFELINKIAERINKHKQKGDDIGISSFEIISHKSSFKDIPPINIYQHWMDYLIPGRYGNDAPFILQKNKKAIAPNKDKDSCKQIANAIFGHDKINQIDYYWLGNKDGSTKIEFASLSPIQKELDPFLLDETTAQKGYKKVDSVEKASEVIEFYLGREHHRDVSFNQLFDIIRISIIHSLPLLFWCCNKKSDVICILEEFIYDKNFPHRKRALCLYLFLIADDPNSVYGKIEQSLDEKKIPFFSSRASDKVFAAIGSIMRFESFMEDLALLKLLNKNLDFGAISTVEINSPRLECYRRNFKSIQDDDLLAKTILGLSDYRLLKAGAALLYLLENPDVKIQYLTLLSLAQYQISYSPHLTIEDLLGITFPEHETKLKDTPDIKFFPDYTESNARYFLNKLRTIRKNDEMENEKVSILGWLGDENDLEMILKRYLSRVETVSDELRWVYIQAINILDEKKYGKNAYRELVQNTQIFNRWWGTSYINHDHIIYGMKRIYKKFGKK